MTGKLVTTLQKRLIAVDIDEVLAQHNRALAEWHNKEYGTRHTAETYFTDYWSKVWNTSPEVAEKRAFSFHASGAHGRLEPVAGAAEASRILKRSYELAIVTVRRQSTITDTRQWVARHYPGIFTDVHFIHNWDSHSTMTKAQLCKKINAQHLIDDSLKHCTLAAQAGIHAMLFGDYSWNSAEALPTGVKRVHGWGEIVDILTSVPSTKVTRKLKEAGRE